MEDLETIEFGNAKEALEETSLEDALSGVQWIQYMRVKKTVQHRIQKIGEDIQTSAGSAAVAAAPHISNAGNALMKGLAKAAENYEHNTRLEKKEKKKEGG